MGFYSRYVFPKLLRFFCSRSPLAKHRKALLAKVKGEILEIGFGTGLNLPHYPPGITKITTVDVNKEMHRLARERLDTSPIRVEHHLIQGDKLPMSDNSVDTVVSTWTLCTVGKVDQALQEIRRVLKPGGQFLFLEHGLSDDPSVQRWQHRLNPIQKMIAGGCHLNRNIEQHLRDAGFTIGEMHHFYLEKTPKIGGYMYDGRAIKAV